MIDHVGIRVRDLARARAFYTAALEPLGYRLLVEIGRELGVGYEGFGLGAGGKPDFWVGAAGEPSTPVHVALAAQNRAAVDAFHAAAVAAGGSDHGAPGIRAQYHPNYYGAFVLDPDGNNIEAVFHGPA